MKLGVATSPIGRRRVPAGHFARMRDARVEAARKLCDPIPLATWTPPRVIRVQALGRST